MEVSFGMAIFLKPKSTIEPSHNKKYCKISMLQDLDMEYKKYFITKMQNKIKSILLSKIIKWR
jgi:hypothetical protein